MHGLSAMRIGQEDPEIIENLTKLRLSLKTMQDKQWEILT
jgi:hypothetical protein